MKEVHLERIKNKMRKELLFLSLLVSFLVSATLFAQSSVLNSGLEKFRQNNYEGAITDFETVLSNEKESPTAKEIAKESLVNCLLTLGEEYVQKKDYTKALSYYEKAYKLAPENEEVKKRYLIMKEKTAEVPAPVVKPEEKPPAPLPSVQEKKIEVPKPSPAEEVKPVTPKTKKAKKIISPGTVTQPLPTVPQPEAPKPSGALTVTKIALPEPQPVKKKLSEREELKNEFALLKEDINNLISRSDEEREKLFKKIEEKDKIIKRIISIGILSFILIVVYFALLVSKLNQSIKQATLPRSGTEISTLSEEVLRNPEQFFLDWLASLENKEIMQILFSLLSDPEKNVREKAFNFLEKMLRVKKFTPETIEKISQTIQKIGLEEGWIK